MVKSIVVVPMSVYMQKDYGSKQSLNAYPYFKRAKRNKKIEKKDHVIKQFFHAFHRLYRYGSLVTYNSDYGSVIFRKAGTSKTSRKRTSKKSQNTNSHHIKLKSPSVPRIQGTTCPIDAALYQETWNSICTSVGKTTLSQCKFGGLLGRISSRIPWVGVEFSPQVLSFIDLALCRS